MNWVGVVDSGVGGLSVWGCLRSLMPHESLLYYADTASCPYGGRGREQIIKLTREAIGQVVAHDVKLIVVACNTMTAAAIETLRSDYPTIPFVGMEPAVKPAANHSVSGVVGILATKATLSGDLYQNTKLQYAERVEIIEVAGGGLVEMVEKRLWDSPQCEALLRQYIDPMIDRGVDTLVLGCTHFPFLAGAIGRIYGDRLTLENPAPAVARRVRDLLGQRQALAESSQVGQYEFRTSGTQADLENIKWFANHIDI